MFNTVYSLKLAHTCFEGREIASEEVASETSEHCVEQAESRILGIWKKLNLESAPGDKKRPEPASGDKQGPGGD